MKKTAVFGLIMLLVISGLSVFPANVTAEEEPLNLEVTNVTDGGFTLSWTTVNSTRGYVKITSPLQTYYDVRGSSSYTDTTHYVDIDDLDPSTSYTFEIYSDNTWYTDSELEFNDVDTLSVPSNGPPGNHVLLGHVDAAGGGDADEVIVYLGPETGSAFGNISILTSTTGDYVMNLGDLRESNGDYYYTGSMSIDARITAEGGDQGTGFILPSVGAGASPQILSDISTDTINVRIDQISFNPEPAFKDVSVQITARIENTGTTSCPSVDVTFYNEQMENIGQETLTNIAASNTANAVINWIPDAIDNSHLITVKLTNVSNDYDYTDHVDTDTLQITLPADASLDPGEITTSTDPPNLGSTVNINAKIYNNGTANADCDVEFRDDDGSLLSIDSVTVPDGTYVTATHNGYLVSQGKFNITVILTNTTSDINLDDNTQIRYIIARMPDMSIVESDISFSSNPIDMLEDVTITARVRNLGSITGTCDVEFHLNSPTGPMIGSAQASGNINAGGSKDFNEVTNFSGGGDYNIYVVLSNFSPDDSDSANNKANDTISVLFVAPDLDVGTVLFDTDPVDENVNLTISVQVWNNGTSAGSANVLLKLESPTGTKIFTEKPVGPINPGNSEVVQWDVNFTGFEGGETQIFAVLADHLPLDINPTNDYSHGYVYVRTLDSDLAVKSIDFSKNPVDVDEYVNISATIHNYGLVDGEADVEFRVDSETGTLLQTNHTSILAPDEEEAYTFSKNFSYAGDRDIFVVLKFITGDDQNESNDMDSKILEVISIDPDLSVANNHISFSKNPADEDEAVVVTATITNNGLEEGGGDVEFRDGTGKLLGTQYVGPINPSGGTAEASTVVMYNTPGDQHIFVAVTNVTPADGNSGNNYAFSTLTVVSKDPDLSIVLDDITFSKNPVDEGEEFTVTAIIRNIGLEAGEGNVSIHRGSAGGPQLGITQHVGPIDPDMFDSAVFLINLTDDGIEHIYVVISDVSPLDGNAGNNEAFNSIEVLPVEPDAGVVSVSGPPIIYEDDDNILFEAVITNDGKEAINSATVQFFYDDPGNPANQIGGNRTLALTAVDGPVATKMVTSDPWDANGMDGTHTIYAVVIVTDPVGETYFINNTGELPDVEVRIRPPYAVNTIPSPGDIYVDQNSNITIEFSKPMDTTLTESAFNLLLTDPVFGTFAWSAGDTIMVFTPNVPLNNDTQYTVLINGTVAKDINGIQFDGDIDLMEGGNLEYTFTTLPEIDTVGPAVINIVATQLDVSYVNLTATINDGPRGGSAVSEAEYTFGTATTPDVVNWTNMVAVSAPFDSISEDVYAWVSVDTLPEANTYYLWVRGRDAGGFWGDEKKVSYYKPDTTEPKNDVGGSWEGIKTLTDLGYGGALEATWDAAMDDSVVRYDVYIVQSGSVWDATDIRQYTPPITPDPGNIVTYTIDGLENEYTYFVGVRAVDAEGNGEMNTAANTTKPHDTTEPWFDGILNVENNGTGDTLLVSWKAAEDANTDPDAKDFNGYDLISYDIFYTPVAAGPIDWTNSNITLPEGMFVNLPNTTFYYEVPGLDTNVDYLFGIRANDVFDDAPSNKDSNELTITKTTTDTVDPEFDGIDSYEVLAKGGGIRLEWDAATDVSDDPITYEVFWTTVEGVFDYGTPNATTENLFINIEGIENDVWYWFVVRAVDEHSNSEENTVVERLMPHDSEAPYIDTPLPWFTSTDMEYGGAVTLDWSAAMDNNTAPDASLEYRLYVDGTDYEDLIYNGSNLMHLEVELENNQGYVFYLHVIDDTGNYHEIVIGETPTDTEDPVSAGNLAHSYPPNTEGEVELTWDEATDAGNTDPTDVIWYQIKRDGVEIANITYDLLPYTDSGLTVELWYNYSIVVWDMGGNKDDDGIKLAVEADDTLAPTFNSTSVNVVDTTEGRTVNVSFEPATDQSTPMTYNLYVGPDAVFDPDTGSLFIVNGIIPDGTDTMGNDYFVITHAGLTNNVTFRFVLRAVDAAGNERSNTDNPTDCIPTDFTAPTFSGLKNVTDMETYGEAFLQWEIATDNTGPIEYLVYWSNLPDNVWFKEPVVTTATNIVVNVSENRLTYFGVRARDSSDEQNIEFNTKLVSETLTDGISPTFGGLETALNTGEGNEIRLAWTAADDNSLQHDRQITYHIYIHTTENVTNNNTYELATTTSTEYMVDTDKEGNILENGKAYFFMVTAVDDFANVDDNDVVMNATPEDITMPEFEGIDAIEDTEIGGEIRITWEAAEDTSSVTYHIFRSTVSNFTPSNDTRIEEDYAFTNYVDDELTNGIEYFYIVWAEDSRGNVNMDMTILSETPTDDTAPLFVGLQTLTDPYLNSGGSLRLVWDEATDGSTDPSDDQITYRIYRHDQPSFNPSATYEIDDTVNTEYTDTGLVDGDRYYYIVRAFDESGNNDDNEEDLSAIPTRPNTAPELDVDVDTPDSDGDMIGNTRLTFEVTYSDPDNDEPDYVRLYIDGQDQGRGDGPSGTVDYTLGAVYRWDVTLGEGEYDFWFECGDEPGDASNDGPLSTKTAEDSFEIEKENVGPELDGRVSPGAGDTQTPFTFSATYSDENDDAPVSGVQVYIDNVPYEMLLLSGGGDYTEDTTYFYPAANLSEGEHEFYFRVSDGVIVETTETFEFTVTEYVAGGNETSNVLSDFFNTGYYGLSGFVWLVLIILVIVGLLTVAAIAGGKKGQAPPPGGVPIGEPSAPVSEGSAPVEETIGCPTCGSKLLVSAAERPVTVECPTCNSQLKIT